jgi:hypothetical protein
MVDTRRPVIYWTVGAIGAVGFGLLGTLSGIYLIPSLGIGMPQPSTQIYEDNTGERRVAVVERSSFVIRQWSITTIAATVPLNRYPIKKMPSFVRPPTPSDEHIVSSVTFVYGWPVGCATCTVQNSPSGSIWTNSIIVRGVHLPTEVLWWRFALSVIVLSAIPYVTSLGARVVRIIWRTRHGLCRTCGYCIGRAPPGRAVCPECGSRLR